MHSILYTPPEEVPGLMERSWKAFLSYKKTDPSVRAGLLRAIGEALEGDAPALVEAAEADSNLEPARLKAELKRTIFQLVSYGEACADGSALDIKIDTASVSPSPPKPDLRKMLVPLGPVVVFGASNFPFAYSTAGGDTACALAAGCTVIVKAHPAHARTSDLVAQAISKAVQSLGLPADIFIHIHSASFETAHALVKHPHTSAVGFTGSFEGGKALYDLACQRPNPIPVFAEMGSVNPVFIMPGKLKSEPEQLATTLAASITQSAGQFCTNPGILVAIEGEALGQWEQLLASIMSQVPRHDMLHDGIARNFADKLQRALEQEGVQHITTWGREAEEDHGGPTLASIPAHKFLENPVLHKEVFGPFSLLVKCRSVIEMLMVARSLEGQLTASLFALPDEMNSELIETLQLKCGRFILNGVPTGVEVTGAMHHGGPFPATTDSRFTAVGADGIKRFARPLCFQNWNDTMLPKELQNHNPLNLWRLVNGSITQSYVTEL
ncbi:MAG: aldehyde dehydrogenase (NADP(+)) [Flavisolibacter sp.]